VALACSTSGTLMGRPASTARPASEVSSTGKVNSLKSTRIESFCDSMKCSRAGRLASPPAGVDPCRRLISPSARGDRAGLPKARLSGCPLPSASAASSTYTLPASAPVMRRLLSRIRSSSLRMSLSEDKAREMASSSLRS